MVEHKDLCQRSEINLEHIMFFPFGFILIVVNDESCTYILFPLNQTEISFSNSDINADMFWQLQHFGTVESLVVKSSLK